MGSIGCWRELLVKSICISTLFRVFKQNRTYRIFEFQNKFIHIILNQKQNTMKNVKASVIKPFLRSVAGGSFFSAKTIKRTTGELRVFNCRFGVTKGVKGVGLAFDPNDKNLIVVWDNKRKDFRMINCDTIQEIKVRGITITFPKA